MPPDFDLASQGLWRAGVEILEDLIFVCASDQPPDFEAFRNCMEPSLRPMTCVMQGLPAGRSTRLQPIGNWSGKFPRVLSLQRGAPTVLQGRQLCRSRGIGNRTRGSRFVRKGGPKTCGEPGTSRRRGTFSARQLVSLSEILSAAWARHRKHGWQPGRAVDGYSSDPRYGRFCHRHSPELLAGSERGLSDDAWHHSARATAHARGSLLAGTIGRERGHRVRRATPHRILAAHV